MGFLVFIFIVAIIGLIIGIIISSQDKKKQQENFKKMQFTESSNQIINPIKITNHTTNSEKQEYEEPFDYEPVHNDWSMNKYKVTGTNPATKRKKGNEVVIVGTDEDKVVERSGLINVICIKLVEPSGPSENQIKYGERLGMEYKCSYSSADYSAILTIIENKQEFEYTPVELAEYAAQHSVYISSYCTFSSFLNILFSKLPKEEKIIFFTSCVYQSCKGFVTYIPSEHPNYNDFREFMEYAKENDSFMKSIYHYSGTELNPKKAIKNLKAKEICMDYFV